MLSGQGRRRDGRGARHAYGVAVPTRGREQRRLQRRRRCCPVRRDVDNRQLLLRSANFRWRKQLLDPPPQLRLGVVVVGANLALPHPDQQANYCGHANHQPQQLPPVGGQVGHKAHRDRTKSVDIVERACENRHRPRPSRISPPARRRHFVRRESPLSSTICADQHSTRRPTRTAGRKRRRVHLCRGDSSSVRQDPAHEARRRGPAAKTLSAEDRGSRRRRIALPGDWSR